MARDDRSDPGRGSGPQRYPGSFLLAFREAAASLDWKITRWLGPAVACVDPQGREHVVGLENLFRRARREERACWPELIATFLGMIDREHLQEPPTDLAAVADRLLLRLGRPVGPRPDAPEMWAQPLAGTALSVNLVIDYPQSMYYVTVAMVADSGRPAEEWLAQATANLKTQTPEGCFEVVHQDSGMRQCAIGDAYDSSRAFLLDELLPETRAEGYLVALPGRDEILVLPVTGPSLAYAPLLKNVAEQSFRTAPYAITDEVFWVHEGRWHLFPIDLSGETVTAQPPPEFLQILDRLVPDEDEEQGEEESEPE
jgi:hypothetical protein